MTRFKAKKDNKDTNLNIRVTKEMKERLSKLADKNFTTVASIICTLVEEELERDEKEESHRKMEHVAS